MLIDWVKGLNVIMASESRRGGTCPVFSSTGLCAPSMGALQMGFKSPVGRPNMMRTKEVMDKLLPEVNSGRATDRGEED